MKYTVHVEYRGNPRGTLDIEAPSPMLACEQAERELYTRDGFAGQLTELSDYFANKVDCHACGQARLHRSQ